MTRFLMSCTECQKRMHFNSNGLEPKGRGGGGRAGASGEALRGGALPQEGLPFAGTDRKVHGQQLSQSPEASVGPWSCPESLILGLLFLKLFFKCQVSLKNQ